MDVLYRLIEGFTGYRARNDGVVESCWRRGGPNPCLTETWRPLKPTPQHRGHLAVCLVRGGRKYTRHVHRLVLEAFAGPCPEGRECCHEDGDPANNSLGNLRWDTHQANMDDMLRHGTRRMGTRAGAKLAEEEVLDIRRLKAAGVPMDRLAASHGVSRANIEAIVYRRSWRHLAPALSGPDAPANPAP
jgi:hypothetical protein